MGSFSQNMWSRISHHYGAVHTTCRAVHATSVSGKLFTRECGTVYIIRDVPRESVTGRASSSSCPAEVRAGMDPRRGSESPAAVFLE